MKVARHNSRITSAGGTTRLHRSDHESEEFAYVAKGMDRRTYTLPLIGLLRYSAWEPSPRVPQLCVTNGD